MEKIVIIDDDKNYCETLTDFLSQPGFQIFCANDGLSGFELILKVHPDIILTDLKMQGINGIEVLKRIKEFDSKMLVILITAFDDMESTIEAMQLGAYDYVEKSAGLEYIADVVSRALDSRKLSEQLIISISNDDEYPAAKKIIGRNQLMREIFKKIGRVSSNRVTVLLQGESGTGKELVAHSIHFTGITKNKPFIAVNCSALSESLLESELFGHEKGSFTGAIKEKKGKFELAGDGTIFLDEISELSPNLQVKLLRVIQEREFEKVGGESSLLMNARVIIATNKDLTKLVDQGKFREDLYYRLKVFTIDIPPLRERREDIPLLVIHFLKRINNELNKHVYKIPYEVMEMLQNFEWSGNVRELQNALMQAVVLANGDVLEKRYLNLESPQIEKLNLNITEKILPLSELEKIYIKEVLVKLNWNKREASRLLGIAKTTLYNKIEYYNLSKTS